jgi:hypothetical protein
LQIGVFPILWDVPNEHVVGKKFLFVASKQVLIELKSSALLTIDIEISHFLTSFLKLNWVLNGNHGRVERSGNVSSDLWLPLRTQFNLRKLVRK